MRSRRSTRLQEAVRWDSTRMVLARPAQAAAQGSGLLLLVAIQHFDAGSTAKALLAASIFIGLLASPLAVSIVARLRLRASRALAALLALATAALTIASLSPSFGGFLAGALIGVPLVSAATPLVTAIWRQNVPSMMRGRLFSRANSAAALFGLLSALAVAAYLGGDAGRYRVPLAALTALLLAAALASLRTPSRPLERSTRNPLSVLTLLYSNRTFGVISASWVLVGIANLATLPLRVEYIASGDYVAAYSAGVVLVVTAVLPQLTALVSTLAWGRLFDRTPFPTLRIVINTFFALSVIAYFAPTLHRQVLGSLLLGIGQGGGMVTWNLWVTKYAPPRRTADYMAVHTFLTGARGLIAPFFAYRMLDSVPLLHVAWMAVGLNVVASLVLVGVLLGTRAGRAGRERAVA